MLHIVLLGPQHADNLLTALPPNLKDGEPALLLGDPAVPAIAHCALVIPTGARREGGRVLLGTKGYAVAMNQTVDLLGFAVRDLHLAAVEADAAVVKDRERIAAFLEAQPDIPAPVRERVATAVTLAHHTCEDGLGPRANDPPPSPEAARLAAYLAADEAYLRASGWARTDDPAAPWSHPAHGARSFGRALALQVDADAPAPAPGTFAALDVGADFTWRHHRDLGPYRKTGPSEAASLSGASDLFRDVCDAAEVVPAPPAAPAQPEAA